MLAGVMNDAISMSCDRFVAAWTSFAGRRRDTTGLLPMLTIDQVTTSVMRLMNRSSRPISVGEPKKLSRLESGKQFSGTWHVLIGGNHYVKTSTVVSVWVFDQRNGPCASMSLARRDRLRARCARQLAITAIF